VQVKVKLKPPVHVENVFVIIMYHFQFLLVFVRRHGDNVKGGKEGT
jgi:hypothetical protein